MGLVLKRQPGQTVKIGESILTIDAIKGNTVSLRIDAPSEVKILRGELKPFDKPKSIEIESDLPPELRLKVGDQ